MSTQRNLQVSTQFNPHLLITVKCAGPGCANIHRESNHWFLVTIEPATFICRPFSSAIDLQEADKPVCGQACAQKLLECFLAKTVSHPSHHQPSHPGQSITSSASHPSHHHPSHPGQSITSSASHPPHQQPSHPGQSAGRHHINSVINHSAPEDNMHTPAPDLLQSTPPINEQFADPISTQYAPAASLQQPELISCVYIGLQCSQCGDVRQALNNLPAGETTFCPQCGATCPFSRLGTGLTSRELPFHEITSPCKQNVTPFHHAPEIALRPRPWQQT